MASQVARAPGAHGPEEVGPAVKSPDVRVQARARRSSRGRAVIEVVVLAGAALFVVHRAGRLGEVAGAFDKLHWHWLFLGVGAEACSISALSWLQQRILRAGGLAVRLGHLLPVTMASNAVAQSLPAGTLFAQGYAFRQYQRLGASSVLGIWAELSAGALAAAGLAAVAVAGAAVVGSGLEWQLLPALVFVLAGALVAAGLFRQTKALSGLLGDVLASLQRVLPKRARERLRSAQVATLQMESFRPSLRTWVLCWLAAALNWAMDAVVLIVGLLSVGGPVPWRGVLLCYATAQVLVELPITPGGLGVVEGGLVEVLIRFHVPAFRATAATLMYRAVSYWLLVLVGWAAASWLAVHNRRAVVGADVERATLTW